MAAERKWGGAEVGAAASLVLAAVAWGGLPGLLSQIPIDRETPLHSAFVYLALLVAISAVAVLWHLLDEFWMRRIEDLPTSRVRSMAAGAVELEGRAGVASLVSPLTGQACVYWDYEIWREGSDDELIGVCFRSSSAWPVLLRDETGSVWIDTRGGEVVPSRSDTTRVPAGPRRDPKIARFLELHAAAEGVMRIQERWIAPGDPLFLHGSCRPRRESEATRERVARILAVSREMEEREAADPAIVADTALACVGASERRRHFERELEKRLAERPHDAGPLVGHGLASLREAAREASERALTESQRRFARWILAASEGARDPAHLALAAHVAIVLDLPDQALLVAPDRATGLPLDLTCLSEAEIVGRHRRFRAKMMRRGSVVATGGFALGAVAGGTAFVVLAFGAFCFAVPFAVGVGCLLRTQWGRELVRLQLPTAQERFPS